MEDLLTLAVDAHGGMARSLSAAIRAALDAMIARRAQIIAYIDDYSIRPGSCSS
jgi:hypothetical protein